MKIFVFRSQSPYLCQIGMRIYKKRKELGLTQEELADRSGLSQSFLTCIERGEKGPGCQLMNWINHMSLKTMLLSLKS